MFPKYIERIPILFLYPVTLQVVQIQSIFSVMMVGRGEGGREHVYNMTQRDSSEVCVGGQ